MRRRSAGITRFELLVVLSLVLVLAGVLLQRLQEAQRAAERTAVVAVLDTLRAALWLEVAARVGREGDGALLQLSEENLFPRLGGSVTAYGGEVPEGRVGMQGGFWYYEKKTGTILYQPRFSENFAMDLGVTRGVEFKITMIYRQDARLGRVFEGLRVVGHCDCSWLPKYYTEEFGKR